MSKTMELARHLETLHINNMYKSDFYWTWDKTDEELEAIFTVADALRDLRERNKSTRIFDSGLGISIFRDNSTRTRFSFASACNLLGLQVQDLDEKKSQIAHGETVRETANMVSFMAEAIGIRDDMYIGEATNIRRPLWTPCPRATGTAFWSSVPRWSISSAMWITPPSAWPICSISSITSAAWKI